MKRLARFSARAADAVLAAMLAALFLTFLLQIADRYLLGARFGWTLELTLTLWLWLVLFGAGVVLRDADDVKFDMLATAVRPQLQRLFALVCRAGDDHRPNGVAARNNRLRHLLQDQAQRHARDKARLRVRRRGAVLLSA